MNYSPINSEQLAPVFPSLSFSGKNLKVNGNQITFSLVCGCSSITVTVNAVSVSSECEIEKPTDLSEGFYMDYQSLEVKDDAVAIVASVNDVWAVVGMPFRLTADQVWDLNEYLSEFLEDRFKDGFLGELAA